MRLFTGIDIPGAIRTNVEEVVRRLKPAAGINWIPSENFHVTLKFIGQWPEQRLPEITTRLSEMPQRGPVRIHLAKLGFFPNARSPHTFWAGIDGGPELNALAASIDAALAAAGVQREERPYSPHLTLARIKLSTRDRAPIALLRETAAPLVEVDFGNFEAAEFHLYSSKPGPRGSVYTKLAPFPI